MGWSARLAAIAALGLAAGCASGGASTSQGGATQGPPVIVGSTPVADSNAPWPVKVREHVDLWLHGFAMIYDDTTRVPYFERGYRDHMVVLKNRSNITTLLDQNRDVLRARMRANPALINAQFLPLYFGSWSDMRQVIGMYLQAGGDPRAAGSAQMQNIFGLLNSYFPSPSDRQWLDTFVKSLDDESARFYHSYWVEQQRERASVIPVIDSLWQKIYRPDLQGYLNHTQQQNGDFLLSLPLDGEGRTITMGKEQNEIAVAFPARPADAVQAIYVFAHEASGVFANAAVSDNTTPAERRTGAAERYSASALVRGGAMLLQRLAPDLAAGYARYYLAAAGLPAPAGDPQAALAAAFPLPDVIVKGMQQQLQFVLGGI